MEKKENSKGMPENKKISGTNIMESQSVGYKDRWIEYSETPEIFPQEAVASQSSERNSKAIALSPQVSTRFAVNEAFTMVTERTEVNYLPKKGYNAEAAYSVQESGNNGQGRVCLATGILNFVYNDVDWNGNRLPVSIFHVFNTPVEGESENFYPTLYNSGYATEDAANRTIGMRFGKSWKLNYQQYLYALNESEYVYCDEYGSEYIFKKKETEEGEKVSENLYTDSSEKGYELDIKTNIVKRDGMYYVFDKKSCLLQEIQDESGNKIRIGYEGAAEGESGSEWKIKELTDGVGRIFTFSYNADGTLSTITDAAGKNTVYTYTNGRLTKITRPDGTIDAFSYYGDGMLNKAGKGSASGTEPEGITYGYGSGYKVSRVQNFLENDRFISIDIAYETSRRVKITSPSAQVTTDEERIETYYSLDGKGSIIGKYSQTQTGEVYVSGETQNGVAGSGDSPVMNYFADNLVAGGMVYRVRNAGTGSLEDEYSADSFLGKSYVVRSNETNGINWVMKKHDLNPGTYTVSAYVKPIGELETTEGGACIKIDGVDADYTKAGFCQSPYIRNDDQGFIRIAQTFVVPEEIGNYTEYRVCVGLYLAKGAVLVNGFQLEKGEIPSLLNILSNGSFERISDSKIVDWQGESTNETQNITTLTQDTNGLSGQCLKMTSSDPQHFGGCQRIRLESAADKLERFILSGFAKANVAELVEGQKFELRAELFYEGSDENIPDESYAVSFDAGVEDWQLKSVSFEKAAYRPISSIRVVLDFRGHEGAVYFDNIQLVVTDSESVGVEYFETAFEEAETDEGGENEPKSRTDKYGNELGTVTSDGYRALYTTSDYSLNGNDLTAQSDERLNKTLYDIEESTSHVVAEHAPCRSSVYYEYYDGSDNLKAVKTELDGKEIKTEYTYSSDDLTQIKTNTTTYNIAYTSAHNVESIGVSGQTPLVSYEYNEKSGRLKKATYPNGSVMECTYDREGRVISEVWTKNGTQEAKYEYTYDHEGNLIRSVDYGRNVLYRYTYKNGQLVESRECKFTVDNLGRIIRDPAASLDERYNYTQTEDGIITPEEIRITEGNDGLGRRDYREIRLGNKLFTEKYEYHNGKVDAHQFEKMGGEPTTNLVSEIEYSDGNRLGYEYDANGNIKSVYENGNLTERYEYDGLGRLTRADNKVADKTEFYEYDECGNILRKETYGYTLGMPEDVGEKKRYRYESEWKDCLTYYSGYGDTMTYVGGNPNMYHGYTLEWEKGRQLKGMSKSGSSLSFEYNANGIRTKKTVNGVVHSYYLNGTNVLLETIENGNEVDVLEYVYDNNGEVCGLKHNGSVYLYVKNLQGDVIRILDRDGKPVVRYVYNAWGKIEKLLDGNGRDISGDVTHIGNKNPIRYRSYYYDTESELYYLQSRYYDPETCRFINADKVIGYNNGDYSYNVFSYCGNDAINRCEVCGYFWKKLWKTVKKVVSTVLHVVNTIAVKIGINTAAIGAVFLDMKKVDGIYHANFNGWQQYFGYNDFYDFMFDLATSMKSKKFPFSYAAKSYMLWAWKGDYINLGAGAELGIYYGGNPHWLVDKKLAMDMTLKLKYGGKEIIDWSERTWWITGFNPKYLNKKASDLTATYTVKFNSMGMYNSFMNSNRKRGWKPTNKSLICTYSFIK